jgi:hypothetical protein
MARVLQLSGKETGMAIAGVRRVTVRTRVFLAVILLVGSIASAGAEESSVSHDIRIRVEPVLMLDVDPHWSVQTQQENQDGGRTVEFVADYGVTCNVPGSVIWADLSSSIPEGVRVAVRMESAVGTSTGWRAIRGCSSVPLVHEPRGNEHSSVAVRVEMDGEVDPASVHMDFAFRIE